MSTHREHVLQRWLEKVSQLFLCNEFEERWFQGVVPYIIEEFHRQTMYSELNREKNRFNIQNSACGVVSNSKAKPLYSCKSWVYRYSSYSR